MKLKKNDRIEFRNNTLFEVIFQARFPTIIKISNEDPANFQDVIRKRGFPETKVKTSDLPTGFPDQILKAFSDDKSYMFLSEDGYWKITLTNNFIALTCFSYTNYGEFERHLKTSLEVFCKEYEPTYFNRIGLRYRNMANKKILGEYKDIKEFIPVHIAPELKDDISDEVVGFEKSIQFKDANCVANVRHAMGKISGTFGQYNLNDEESYLIDIDCFTTEKKREVNDVINTSKRFNSDYVRNIFHWSITNELRNAMEPI